MKLSEIFNEVAEMLPMNCDDDRRCSAYICDNITEVTKNGDHRAHKIINERLNGMFSVYDWLIANGYIENPGGKYYTSFSFDEETFVKVQEYRKAWCLELAREFKAKGE